MKYLTSKQIYQIDKLATKKYLIPSFVLMENAGRTVAEFIKKLCKNNKNKRILVFCGPGKNAGDGFVTARYLFNKGFDVAVAKCVPDNQYYGDSRLNLKILKKLSVKMFRCSLAWCVNKNKGIPLKTFFQETDIIVDAIFGIGLNREVSGVYEKVISKLNESKKIIVSIDIPSGLNADTGEPLGCAVKANYTVTMGFLKLGFKTKSAKQYYGKIVLADIGYPTIPMRVWK